MKRDSLVDWLAYLGLVGIVRLTQLNAAMGRAVFRFIMVSAFLFWKSRRKVTVENLAILFPNETVGKLKKTAFNVYMKWADFLAEYPLMARLKSQDNDNLIRVKGMEKLMEAYGRGKGLIIPTAHYGNFEWMNAALAAKGLPVRCVIRAVDNPYIDRLLNGIRIEAGVTRIKSRYAVREIMREVRRGGVVTLATDQNASANGVFIKFLGRWAATVKAPAVLQLRTGAPIIPVYSVRENDGSHTVHVLPEIIIERTGDLKRDVFIISQRIADAQSRFISNRPELWFWLHKRWKTRPGEKDIRTLERFASKEKKRPAHESEKR
ncbi:MAG: acyltransferase [bacterium]|nr:MAG: acyltransferase [bacterium]